MIFLPLPIYLARYTGISVFVSQNTPPVKSKFKTNFFQKMGAAIWQPSVSLTILANNPLYTLFCKIILLEKSRDTRTLPMLPAYGTVACIKLLSCLCALAPALSMLQLSRNINILSVHVLLNHFYQSRQSTTSIGVMHRMGVCECLFVTYWLLMYSCISCKLFSFAIVVK